MIQVIAFGTRVRRRLKKPLQHKWAKGPVRAVGRVVIFSQDNTKVYVAYGRGSRRHPYSYRWKNVSDLEVVEPAKSSSDSLGTATG